MMEHITKNISDAIEDSDMTIKELSEKIGCSTKQIGRWQRNEAEMGIYKLKLLCKTLGVSADYILDLPEDLEWPRRKEVKK